MGPRLVDATVAAMHLRTAYGLHLAPATIRDWARRGKLERHEGRNHFDLVAVVAHARRRGLIP